MVCSPTGHAGVKSPFTQCLWHFWQGKCLDLRSGYSSRSFSITCPQQKKLQSVPGESPDSSGLHRQQAAQQIPQEPDRGTSEHLVVRVSHAFPTDGISKYGILHWNNK